MRLVFFLGDPENPAQLVLCHVFHTDLVQPCIKSIDKIRKCQEISRHRFNIAVGRFVSDISRWYSLNMRHQPTKTKDREKYAVYLDQKDLQRLREYQEQVGVPVS